MVSKLGRVFFGVGLWGVPRYEIRIVMQSILADVKATALVTCLGPNQTAPIYPDIGDLISGLNLSQCVFIILMNTNLDPFFFYKDEELFHKLWNCSTICGTVTRSQYLFHFSGSCCTFLGHCSTNCGTISQKVELFHFVSVFLDTATSLTKTHWLYIIHCLHVGYVNLRLKYY